MNIIFLKVMGLIAGSHITRVPLQSLILLILSSLLSHAHATPTQLSFNHITSSDGLPQNTVTSMLQDRYGFLWVGTHDGLHRYDGYNFLSFKYDSKNPQSISSNVITSLLEDKHGHIWVGTAQGGLNRLDPETGQFVRFTASADSFNSLSHNQVTSLHLDADDHLWVGTYNGLNLYQEETNDFGYFYHNPLDEQSIPNGSVTAISHDNQGNLYIATSDMLARFDPDQQIFKRYDDIDSPTRITTLYLDVDNSLWIGTQLDGLFHLNQQNNRFEQFTNISEQSTSLSSNHIKAILRDSLGNLWVGTEQGGLNLKSRGASNFQRFMKNSADPHSLSINDILSIIEDRSGQIWIGTAGGGINKTATQFNNFARLTHSAFDKNSLSHNFVNQITNDRQGNLWFATLNGIDLYNNDQNSINRINQFFDSNNNQLSSRITSIAVTEKQTIWFANQNGQLGYFTFNENIANVNLVNRSGFLSNQFSNKAIRLLYLDSNDHLWVATDEGLAKLDANTAQILEDFRYAAIGELGTSKVYSILQDNQGIMWFGTFDSGLQRYDPEFKQTLTIRHQLDNPEAISDNTIRSLYQDQQGNLWIGTYNGLSLLTNEDRISGNFKFYNFNESQGLPNNSIQGIVSDNSGNLWLATNRGISRFNPNNQSFKNFTTIDGLPADEFLSNSVIKNNDDLLYFASVAGIALINTQGINESDFQPSIRITQVDVNNTNIFKKNSWRELDNLILNHDQNNITISFSALDLKVPSRVKYRYRLLPFQSEWQELSGRPSAQYGNLNSGDYEFQVRSTNSDLIWFDTTKSLFITIDDPIWATWWAYLFYTLSVIGIVLFFIYDHNKKLIEQTKLNEHLQRVDKLKDEFLANTSHELRTPLNGIIGIAESLREGIAGPLNNKAQNHLNLIIDSGKRLAHQVNEILDFKKLRHHGLLLTKRSVDIRVAAKVVINLLKPLAEEKSLRLTNSLPQFLPAINGDENRIRQILYNLLGNAIKYTDSGYIELTARVVDDQIELCIKDSGIGISKDKQPIIFKPFEQLETEQEKLNTGTGLGLAVTQQLVELHGGKIWLKSKVDQGSEFYFTLPLSNDDIIESSNQADESQLSKVSRTISKSLTAVENASAHILVVDDDPLNRQVLHDFLSMNNYQVSEAIDGVDAIEKINQHRYDLIILDVMMPKLSGFDVTEKIRHTYNMMDLPVLLLSAKNQPDDIDTGLAMGANDYISKPVDRKILLARVANLLSLRKISLSREKALQLEALETTFDQLTKYFPTPLVERILSSNEEQNLNPVRRCITVLFADLVGFTEFSDRCEPETVTDVLNEFITSMNARVIQHKGLLNEVLGDGLVILFGALDQLDKTDQTIQAVSLAVDMQSLIKELSEKWRATGLEQQLNLRIGIHQSYVTLGNFGSDQMIVYRAVGSGVNLAARIQSLAEPGQTLVSYPVFAQADSHFDFKEFDEIKFKGFNHNHKIYYLNEKS
ncbi:MAG: two-component regulator propeller domain-containing protein [Kangiellaceae bacterium]|jgi:signal transduction histidine kinase/ligand-binding sensor domain-containing protein/class 3 adenylate cyclase|nr:two-component regulator propeller domain-containing protein [Kangiellaceae bacterium]